ncbi:hypothetical protein CALK_1689 [Chitinivibrio alkaliphilus ACht1]|uniref:Uncharacterized protein n=1 Tax=Chitinivibrio alkaliphilus ACht1 TaxID=1313304 RepID=U7D4D3_9BACT|nr:hypothetical protein CALK_1689 [Chitinivibrio alkaliphilus ACht1]
MIKGEKCREHFKFAKSDIVLSRYSFGNISGSLLLECDVVPLYTPCLAFF